MGETTYSGIVENSPINAADIINALNSLMPAGVILPYGGATAPSGWAFCHGQVYLRSQYPALFAAIGTAWNVSGVNDDSFRIPDMRGATVRGVGRPESPAPYPYIQRINNSDSYSNMDPIYVVGGVDNDAIRNITGWLEAPSAPLAASTQQDNALFTIKSTGVLATGWSGETVWARQRTFNASNVVPVATENKVKARGVNFIIKLQ